MSLVTEAMILEAFESHLQASFLAAPAFYTAAKIEQIRKGRPPEYLTQKCSQAWSNGRILSLSSKAGLGTVDPPNAFEIDLSPDTDNVALGLAVLDVLGHSWELTLHYLKAEIRSRERDELNAIYIQWLTAFMQRHKYKTQKALFNNMLHCHILCRSDILTISPTNHNRLDGWSGEGVPADSDVILQANSSPESIGAALRLCFSRCLDTYGHKIKR